jgi:predicted protein tyrosine phosphatase
MLIPLPSYLRQPPAYFHTRILVGPGAFLTQRFVRDRGISHVINCAFPGDSPEWFQKAHPDRYVCLSALDSSHHNILDWYPRFEQVLHSFLRSPPGGIVYVHCQAGMNRSAYLALAYVCTRFHLDGEGTLEAVKRQRPCMFQNQVYRGQVLSFINGCLSRTEDPRGSLGGTDNRNAGLCASGGGSDLARLDVDTGRAPD